MNPKYRWIGFIVLLLAIPCFFYATMLVLIQVHPVAFEPNFEQRGADWEQIRRQQQRNEELGWMLDLQTAPGDQRYLTEVTLSISDQHGKPIADASVEIDALHITHATKLIQCTMKSKEDGTYRAKLSMRYSGTWEFRVTARRQNDLFYQPLEINDFQPTRR
jgi:FixH protein